jgi:hypothetical protein
MSESSGGLRLRALVTETIQTAGGRRHRADPVAGPTGGPAGNAHLTAWTGLLLLVLFLAEIVTLLDVHGLISWHVVIGVLLVPPALLKTATTGWRIVRYYTGNPAYREAGPPPTFLRILGPLVILSTLAVLGTGLALIALGPQESRQTLLTVAGQRVGALTLHQASFVVWAVATGLHTLARLVPAAQIVSSRATRPGRHGRIAVLVAVVGLAVVSAVLVLSVSGSWRSDRDLRFHGPGQATIRGGP